MLAENKKRYEVQKEIGVRYASRVMPHESETCWDTFISLRKIRGEGIKL